VACHAVRLGEGQPRLTDRGEDPTLPRERALVDRSPTRTVPAASAVSPKDSPAASAAVNESDHAESVVQFVLVAGGVGTGMRVLPATIGFTR